MADSIIRNAEDVREHVEKNDLVWIQTFLRRRLGVLKNLVINIAIIGDVGGGKSSFINAIRGLKDDDEGAAKTGVTETTREAAVYSHPTNDKIKFWDLPGIGTPDCPDLKIYCEKVHLERYDNFLIFIAGRFTENNLTLARKVKSLGKSFFFVRTKIDQDISAQRQKKAFNEESTINDIKKDFSDDLKGLVAVDEAVFLISNFETTKWDFPRLTQAILDALPLLQKESVTLSLNLSIRVCKDVVKQKIQVLRDRVWKVAVTSGVGAAVPIPGLSIAIDIGLLTQEVNFYKTQLRLPDENSEEFHRLTPGLRDQISKFFWTSAVQIGQIATAYAAGFTAEEYVRYIPFVGSVIAGSISFSSTYYLLDEWLNELEETALKILDETNASIVDEMGLM